MRVVLHSSSPQEIPFIREKWKRMSFRNWTEGRKASGDLSRDNRGWGITGRKIQRDGRTDKRSYDSWHSYWTDTTSYQGSWNRVKKRWKEKYLIYIEWKFLKRSRKATAWRNERNSQEKETGINALVTRKWKESIDKIFWIYTKGETYIMKPDMKKIKIRKWISK